MFDSRFMNWPEPEFLHAEEPSIENQTTDNAETKDTEKLAIAIERPKRIPPKRIIFPKVEPEKQAKIEPSPEESEPKIQEVQQPPPVKTPEKPRQIMSREEALAKRRETRHKIENKKVEIDKTKDGEEKKCTIQANDIVTSDILEKEKNDEISYEFMKF